MWGCHNAKFGNLYHATASIMVDIDLSKIQLWTFRSEISDHKKDYRYKVTFRPNFIPVMPHETDHEPGNFSGNANVWWDEGIKIEWRCYFRRMDVAFNLVVICMNKVFEIWNSKIIPNSGPMLTTPGFFAGMQPLLQLLSRDKQIILCVVSVWSYKCNYPDFSGIFFVTAS